MEHVFFITFGIYWAFTLPYMSYLFGEIIERIKNHGISSVPNYQLVDVPLGLYVVIHISRSIGYYLHSLFSLLSIPIHKSYIIKKLFRHMSKQSDSYFKNSMQASLQIK